MPTTDIYTGIYVKNVPKTANLFRRVLNAEARLLQPDLIELTVGTGRLLLNQREMQGPKRLVAEAENELELGIWVHDIEAVYDKVSTASDNDENSQIHYISEIEQQKSGIQDFRFRLAEGYYIRVTGAAR